MKQEFKSLAKFYLNKSNLEMTVENWLLMMAEYESDIKEGLPTIQPNKSLECYFEDMITAEKFNSI